MEHKWDWRNWGLGGLNAYDPIFNYYKNDAKDTMLSKHDIMMALEQSDPSLSARATKEYGKAVENYESYLDNQNVLAITKNKNGTNNVVLTTPEEFKDMNNTVNNLVENLKTASQSPYVSHKTALQSPTLTREKIASFLDKINPFFYYNRSKARDAMLGAYDEYNNFRNADNNTTINFPKGEGVGTVQNFMGQLRNKEQELFNTFEEKKNEYNNFLGDNQVFSIISNNGENKIIERPKEELATTEGYIKNILHAKYLSELQKRGLLGEND